MLPEPEEPIEYDVILTEPAEIEVEAAYIRRIKLGMDNAENGTQGLLWHWLADRFFLVVFL